jgi:hypothetical protein
MTVLICVSSSLISGCGAGNLIAAGATVGEALNDSGAVQNTNLAVASVPIEDEPGGPAITIPVELSALNGRAVFFHQFDNNPDFQYIAEAFYSENTVVTTDSGTLAQLAVSRLYYREFANAEFENGGTFPLFCTFIASVEQYLCVGPLASDADTEVPANVNFLLDRLQINNATGNLESSGDFEYCPEGQPSADCVDELVNQPDGPVALVVEPNLMASLDNGQERIHGTANIEEYTLARMQYLEQGTLDFNLNNGMVRTWAGPQDDLTAAYESLLSR